jgi:hypothetical protein
MGKDGRRIKEEMSHKYHKKLLLYSFIIAFSSFPSSYCNCTSEIEKNLDNVYSQDKQEIN